MEEGAEKECEKNVENAIKWNEKNAEVFVLKANLLLSQNKSNEAIPVLLQSYSLWKNLGCYFSFFSFYSFFNISLVKIFIIIFYFIIYLIYIIYLFIE